MSWTTEPFLAIDTETTGINPFEDRIVQVAVVEVLPDGSTRDPWSSIVDPGVEIPDGAAGVHGITTTMARASGILPGDALGIVADRIHRHGAYRAVVMFNARFDWPILLCEAERHGVDFPCIAPILDPYLVDRMVERFRPGKRRLVDVSRHYDVPLDEADAHGALADAIAAGRVMRQIIDRYPAVADHTLAGVYVRQVKGAEEDRQRFVDWKRRNSDPTFDSPAGWPIPAGVSA